MVCRVSFVLESSSMFSLSLLVVGLCRLLVGDEPGADGGEVVTMLVNVLKSQCWPEQIPPTILPLQPMHLIYFKPSSLLMICNPALGTFITLAS